MLNVEGIVKRYGARVVLNGLSLRVRKGERFFLLGPSGCGKTTLLRIIAGLESFEEGSVEIGGRTVAGKGVFRPPHRRGIGYMFQEGALWPHLTVRKHLAYAPGAGSRRAWHDHLLKITGLQGRENDYPRSLSGGEAQRLALARALSNQPALLLLDEPLRNLDRNLAVALREEILKIVAETETTVLFVTHDQDEALSMADRMMLMDSRGAVQTGTPKVIYHEPASPWAAEFFGPVNRFIALTDSEGLGQTPLGAFPTGMDPGTACELVIRAFKVEARIEGEVGIPAQVRRQIFFGEHSLIDCEVQGERILARGSEVSLRNGDLVFLHIQEAPSCFSSQNGLG